MVPRVESISMGLKLGLTAAIPDKAAGEEVGTCIYASVQHAVLIGCNTARFFLICKISTPIFAFGRY